MRLTRPILVFSFLILLFSSACQESNSKEYLATATGRIDEIIVVSSNHYWNGAIGASVKKLLQKDYPSLPQPEPYFDVNYVPYSAFGKLFKKTSTIVLISALNEPSELTNYILNERNRVAEKVNLVGKHYFALNDVWASPQKVIFLYGDTKADLEAYLEAEPQQLLRTIQGMENDKALRNFMASGVDGTHSNEVTENLNLGMKIPKTYRKVILEENMAWFRQDIEDAIENIQIQTVPMSGAGAFNTALPINLRDGMGRLVSTAREDSKMVTDTLVGVQQRMLTVDGAECIETRGLWKMTGDFMGGPFINYCIKDEANDRYVVMDYFVYAPQYKKRRYIRRAEMFGKEIKLNP